MRSLNPFLQSPRDHRIECLNRIVSILLQGLALHSFCHDENEFEKFQASLRKLREQLTQADDDDSKLLLAGSAIRTLEEHSAAAANAVAARQNQMESAMALVSESLLKVAQIGEAQALELKESERDVASARKSSDMAAARERLATCLEDIRLRVLSRNETTPLPSQSWSDSEVDSVTGLPDSRKAVDAIVAAWSRREEYSVAVFAVRRLETINTRFGFETGDDILRVLTGHLTGLFAETRLLFRWRGPCLLGLIEKKLEPRIIAESQRLASTRLQHSITKKDREVILPISLVWTLVPLVAKNLEAMLHRLDELTTNRLREESYFGR